ncbi:hypothetical protein GF324_10820 [bacterium]|nr:hypothetical protein [bacterium]
MTEVPSDVRYVPYRQIDEAPRRAAIAKVDFSLEGFSDTDIQVLGHLMEAAEVMNAVFRNQYEPRTFIIRPLILALMEVAEGEEFEALSNYLAVLDLQNSPWSLLPRKNHVVDLSVDDLRRLAKKACKECERRLDAVLPLLVEGQETPDKANFYPPDFTDEEFKAIPNHPENTVVDRDADGKPVLIRNEVRYRKTLRPAIRHLKAARDLTKNAGFRLYLDAKIAELEHGSEENRRLSDYTWVRHDSDIDIVISTALELYLDNYRNARGAASGGVYVINSEADDLLHEMVNHVQTWERNAPWTHKKAFIHPENLPKLKFVDVLCWAGDYVTGPFTIIAQSLPNDEWVGQNVGTVNMVYMNTGRAVHKVGTGLAAQLFLTGDEYEKVKDLLFDANTIHSSLHEIGHTTGKLAPEHENVNANKLFEEEYSALEETRAELFGLWALHELLKDKVISEEMVHACYDGMLVSMLMSLKFDPVQAHNKARNGMFHRFEAEGAIERVEEDGELRFRIVHEKAHAVVTKMLGEVGDLKASGNKQAAVEMREKWVYTDELKTIIEERTKHFPLGRGLIFPRLKKAEDGTYLRELEYADNFSDQPKFALEVYRRAEEK